MVRNIDYQKCARYFSYLFWMVIPREIGGILVNQNINGGNKTIFIIGTVISIVQCVASAFFLWQLQTEDTRYKTGSILYLAMTVVRMLSLLLPAAQSIGGSLCLAIINVVISIFYSTNFYSANSDILEKPSPELSERWLKIKKYYLIAIGLTTGSLVLLFIPIISVITALVGAVMAIVVAIMELIALYKSARACREYDGPIIIE